MSSNKLKVFSTFSGIGGLDLPFSKDDNFEVIGFSELDKFSSAVLKYHYPEVYNFGDITTLDLNTLPHFDILIGGFPCNDISYQGKQEGIIEGKKSSLFKYLLNILDHSKPKYFLFENVEALLHINDGGDFAYVITALGERGYSFRWEVLDSADFGVPQQRKRLFIFGFREIERSHLDNSVSSLHQAIKVQSDKREEIQNSRPVVGFEEYRIDENGIIYGKLGNKMKFQDINSYPSVHFRKANKCYRKLVHKLVYETFRGPIPENYEINHKDHNKQNTALSNLELVTSAENKRLYYEFLGEKKGVRLLPSGMFRHD